jgi:prepilin-type N-terminal cleavage/methylation domain-containing protein
MNKIYECLIDKRALTLIEILLVVIILGIVIAIATTMIIQTFGVVGSSSSRMSTKQLTALAEERIEKHLRTAFDSDDNDFGEEQSQWIFKGYSDAGEKIDYQVDHNNDKLTLTIGTQSGEVILNNVNDFYIEKVDNKGVFRLYFDVKDNTDSIKSKKIVTARNY